MNDIRRRKSRNANKRRKRILKIKMFLVGVSIGTVLLLIHIVVSLWILVTKTIEYNEKVEIEENIAYEIADVLEGVDLNDEANIDIKKAAIIEKLKIYAECNNFSIEDYPDDIIELLVKNPETENFVLNYPSEKNSYSTEKLDECLNQDEVPLLMQWDSRWGYYEYGDNVMGLTGCGPTCLSMVAIHLLQDSSLTPIYVASYADRNGYYADGVGTAWSFMSQGAKGLGLNAQEVGLDENRVLNYLQQGKPIICAMGRGDFTETGHFIVMIGVEDGKIKVNDPNSKERSEKLWDFNDIKYQIKNMWVYY